LIKVLPGILCTGFFIVLFFRLAGSSSWLRGWVYVVLLTCGQGSSALYMWQRNPELLKRRAAVGAGAKGWDKRLLAVFGLLYCAILFVAAWDERQGWSAMPGWLWVAGAGMYVFFVIVLTWAMAVNPHFEKFVRIQKDRDHRVIATGPYRIVRHPGYLATIIGFLLAAPLLLGSWWAFVPAWLAVACLVVRTALEDKTLRRELVGYEEYTRQVRYRLVAGLW